jgi:hypothetical protein
MEDVFQNEHYYHNINKKGLHKYHNMHEFGYILKHRKDPLFQIIIQGKDSMPIFHQKKKKKEDTKREMHQEPELHTLQKRENKLPFKHAHKQ